MVFTPIERFGLVHFSIYFCCNLFTILYNTTFDTLTVSTKNICVSKQAFEICIKQSLVDFDYLYTISVHSHGYMHVQISTCSAFCIMVIIILFLICLNLNR